MLMILARLQAVDRTLYEAAKVDGAGSVQQFAITLPELRFVIGSTYLLRLMWTFNKFDDIFLYTGGGLAPKPCRYSPMNSASGSTILGGVPQRR